VTDFIVSFGIWAGVLVGSAILLGLLGLARIRAAWLVFGVLIFAGYFAALMLGGDYIPVKDYFPGVEWNWSGKIATILFSLVLIILLAIFSRSARPSAVGFTLRQAPGSLTPALIASALLLAASLGLEIMANDGTDTSPERLLYQATMPGLDEELFFRGVFLAVMGAAVQSGRVSILGAPIGWAGLIVTLLFGLGHGVMYAEGAVNANWPIVAITGAIGFGLLWIRERTGSILIPILAHNAINVALSFF